MKNYLLRKSIRDELAERGMTYAEYRAERSAARQGKGPGTADEPKSGVTTEDGWSGRETAQHRSLNERPVWMRDGIELTLLEGGTETLEVVGESYYQANLWRLVAARQGGEHVREDICAVLVAEDHNPYDPAAVAVWIQGLQVGHLSRQNAQRYRPGLLALQQKHSTPIALAGVIAGGGMRDDGPGMLGVFLDHDPQDFGLRRSPSPPPSQSQMRTALSDALATDVTDDSYDLSWMRGLPTDDIRAIPALRQLLAREPSILGRHFMYAELERLLYRCRDVFVSALSEYDDVCRKHDAEMKAIRMACIEKWGKVPLLEIYRQMAIRQQKAHDFTQALWWSERGIVIYGDDGARPEAVEDLKQRARTYRAKLDVQTHDDDTSQKGRAGYPQPTVVVVAFRDVPRDRRDPLASFSPDYGYAYLWPFAEPPRIGQWAVVQGIDGPATVVIGAIGLPPHARGMELKSIDRLIPQSEVEEAHAAHDAAVDEWLNMARHAAGLPTNAPVSAKAPSGFDALPPVVGTADAVTADNYAYIWWRARKLASESGRDPDEVATFQRIAQGWRRVRDRTARSEQLAAVTAVADSIDLSTAIRNVENRSRAEVESMLFAGKPLWDWLEYVQELGRQGRDDEALELVGALITAAEQEAQMSGREPAPAFTQRAAIIYRKRHDYLAEIAVLERWEKACPPEERGPGAMQQTFVKRLMRARELAAKQAERDI